MTADWKNQDPRCTSCGLPMHGEPYLANDNPYCAACAPTFGALRRPAVAPGLDAFPPTQRYNAALHWLNSTLATIDLDWASVKYGEGSLDYHRKRLAELHGRLGMAASLAAEMLDAHTLIHGEEVPT